MKVTIEVKNCKEIDASIEVQQKAIDRKPLSGHDATVLADTKYILMGIREALKEVNKYGEEYDPYGSIYP